MRIASHIALKLQGYFAFLAICPVPVLRQESEAATGTQNAMTADFETLETMILSEQMPAHRVPAYLNENPEFATWYRERAAARQEMTQDHPKPPLIDFDT
jgi:hypothetical protein